jgi:hypothetical protein
LADGFTVPPKEGVLRTFIALKNPLPSKGSDPANLGFNGKHANHYTAEDDNISRREIHKTYQIRQYN